MRITGGRARGIPLTVGRAQQVRPAMDRMREAVFSSLGPMVLDARVLDLFAGSGAYGLEALSRGASQVLAVEQNRQAVMAWQKNLAAVSKSLGMRKPPARVLTGDAFSAPLGGGFDLLFADPPYPMLPGCWPALADLADRSLKRESSAVFLLEAPGGCNLPPDPRWVLVKPIGKGKGAAQVLRFARAEAADPPATAAER